MSRLRGRNRALLIAGAVVLAVAGLVAWLATSWLGTYRQAQSFQADVSRLRTALSAQEWQVVADQVPTVLQSARALEASTQGLAWRLLEDVPMIGVSASAVGELSTTTANLLAAAQPLTPYAERIVHGDVRRADGSVDLAAVQEIGPVLARLALVMEGEAARLALIDASALRPEISGPVVELRQQLLDAAPSVVRAADIAARVPHLLGADGERTWLVLLQNPAESRGTGGFPGGYLRIFARDGVLSVASVGKSGDLNALPIPTDGAPEDARLLWGSLLSVWRTFNLSPDFPLAGSLAAAGMAARGEPVDGVIAVDPRTVAAIMTMTGPVTAEGQTISAENVERFFTVDSYALYPDMTRRAEVSIALVGAVMESFVTGTWDPVTLADALLEPIAGGRVRVWSADPAEEEWLVSTPVGGSVPNTVGPVVAVAFNNAAGNKMDAFVSSGVDYRPGRCPTALVQRSTLGVTLRNDAPVTLPDQGDYGRADDPLAPEGSTRMLVHVYAPVDATFMSATLNGSPVDMYVGHERNRPVWWTSLTLNRGEEKELDLRFDEPDVPEVEPMVLPQGMVIDEKISVTPDASCA